MAWCPWRGMIKLLCQGNDLTTNLQLKAGCLACKPAFSSGLPKKSSSIHLRATVWKIKLKCFRNGTQCLKFGLGRRVFTLADNHVCTFDKVTGILAVNSAISSLSDQPEIRTSSMFVSFFQNVFTVSFTLVIKINDLAVENLAVNFEIHLCSPGVTTEKTSFGVCASR